MRDPKNTIFIPIAACEERFIEQTIKSALLNAKYPEKIYFGIFNNIINKDHSLLNNKFITEHPQIFYTEINTPCPMGTGFSRMNASLLQFIECEYMFQIDAHTLFTKNWDDKIINIFNKIKTENEINENKIILSASPGMAWSYDENNIEKIFGINYESKTLFEIDPYNLEETFFDKTAKGLVKIDFTYDGKQGNWLDQSTINFPIVYGMSYLENKEYEEVNCVYGAFMFSTTKLNREVLHDPEDYFNGDQTNYSIRLLSRGYRIFTPKNPAIAVLDKFIINNNDQHVVPSVLDKLHNWRSIKYKNNGQNYYEFKGDDDRQFFNDMISGKYFGYWGTTDQLSLDNIRKQINYGSCE